MKSLINAALAIDVQIEGQARLVFSINGHWQGIVPICATSHCIVGEDAGAPGSPPAAPPPIDSAACRSAAAR